MNSCFFQYREWKLTVGRTINGLLGGSSGMDSGHQALNDSKLKDANWKVSQCCCNAR